VLVFAPNSGVQFCTDLETNFHVSCIDGIMYIAGGSCKLIRLFQTYFIYIYIYIYIYTEYITIILPVFFMYVKTGLSH